MTRTGEEVRGEVFSDDWPLEKLCRGLSATVQPKSSQQVWFSGQKENRSIAQLRQIARNGQRRALTRQET